MFCGGMNGFHRVEKGAIQDCLNQQQGEGSYLGLDIDVHDVAAVHMSKALGTIMKCDSGN